MLDTRGSGIEYTRDELSEFTKIADLFTNDRRCIYAELLSDTASRKVYFREWLGNDGAAGDNCNFAIINSMDELKVELKKDVDHGDLAPGKVNKICDEIREVWED